MARLSLTRIEDAVSRISDVFLNSPQFEIAPLNQALGCRIVLKVETMNPIRCFKGRGTDLVVAHLADGDGPKSAVCASAGNLGQGLAFSGRQRGIEPIVVASAAANAMKLERIGRLGAAIHLVDGDFEMARQTARDMAEADRLFLVEDSENLDTCEGAGTIGLELVRDPEPIDAVLIALGGGAMATGVGHVFKSLAPRVQVITVQPAGAPAMTLSWRAGRVIVTDTMDTIADGVAGRCPIPDVLADLLEIADDAVLVGEESIIASMRLLYDKAGLVVEPSAALGIAAILEGQKRFAGKRVATIICGGNVVPDDFRRWVP